MCHRAQRSQTLPQEVVPRGASGYCSSYKLLESIQRRSCPALSIADGWVDEKAWTCCLVAVSSGSKEVVQRSGRREEISLRGRTARIGRGLRAAMSSLPRRATVGYHPTHLLAHRLAVGAASSLEAEMLSQERGVGSPVGPMRLASGAGRQSRAQMRPSPCEVARAPPGRSFSCC